MIVILNISIKVVLVYGKRVVHNTVVLQHDFTICPIHTFLQQCVIALSYGDFLEHSHHLRVTVNDLLSGLAARCATTSLTWLFFLHIVRHLDHFGSAMTRSHLLNVVIGL